ncbi:RasGEF, partial [Nowakowskiella sp. JEL0078]
MEKKIFELTRTHSENISPPPTTFNNSETNKHDIFKIISQIQLASILATIQSFKALTIAFPLCQIEQSLFSRIQPEDILTHRPQTTSQLNTFGSLSGSAINESTDFFNYIARIVESSILESSFLNERASTINCWIKIASSLFQLNNLQTLKAVVSALGTPPILRLKRTWALVLKKQMVKLRQLQNLMSEQNNYSEYREWMKVNSNNRPMIPFIGIYIHDITYLAALSKKENLAPKQDERVRLIFEDMKKFSQGPKYSYPFLLGILMTSGTSKVKKFSTSSGSSTPSSKRQQIFVEKKPSFGLSPTCSEELQQHLKNFDHEELGTFVSHWILSRKWQTEKEMDELSIEREPRKSSAIAEANNKNILNKHESFVIEGRDVSINASDSPIHEHQFAAAISFLLDNKMQIPESVLSFLNNITMQKLIASSDTHPKAISPQKRNFVSRNTSIFNAIRGTATAISSVTKKSVPGPNTPYHENYRSSLSAIGNRINWSSISSLSTTNSKDDSSSAGSLRSFNLTDEDPSQNFIETQTGQEKNSNIRRFSLKSSNKSCVFSKMDALPTLNKNEIIAGFFHTGVLPSFRNRSSRSVSEAQPSEILAINTSGNKINLDVDDHHNFEEGEVSLESKIVIKETTKTSRIPKFIFHSDTQHPKPTVSEKTTDLKRCLSERHRPLLIPQTISPSLSFTLSTPPESENINSDLFGLSESSSMFDLSDDSKSSEHVSLAGTPENSHIKKNVVRRIVENVAIHTSEKKFTNHTNEKKSMDRLLLPASSSTTSSSDLKDKHSWRIYHKREQKAHD